jgi:hypothetical protein
MRLGPGKHLKGLTLMDGIIKPEEFDYFRMRTDYTWLSTETDPPDR